VLVLSFGELTRINTCKEVLMQRRRTRLIILLLTFVLQALRLHAQVESEQVPEMLYRVVPNFLKLPSDLYFSEVSGVALNSKGPGTKGHLPIAAN
jgi:hypothetical protein